MDLAVIGAGAAAVCLLDTLSRQDAGPGRLLVFDSSPRLWRGRPYQQDSDAVRVNLPPMAMSARYGDDAHFANWLRTGPYPVEQYRDDLLGQPLPPRAVYGDYLEETAESALAELRRRGRPVDIVRAEVTGAQHGDRLTLRTADGREYTVDRAVLCVGAGGPQDAYQLSGAPGFILNPYPLADTLRDLEPSADVAVIGSGLTAVDVVADLAARGHRGGITLLSRHGLLPAVQQRRFEFEPKHLTPAAVLALAGKHGPLDLDHLLPLFRAELAEFGEDLEPVLAEMVTDRAESPADRLRRQLNEVDAEPRARRVLLFLVRSLGPLVMGLLSERDRAAVQEVHFRMVSSLCAPMPPVNAATMLTLSDKGQLSVVAGLEQIQPADQGGFTIRAGGTTHTADTVINAVNPPPHEISPESASLLSSLAVAGSAELSVAGGLVTEPGTGRLMRDGHPDTGLHALGDLAGVNLFLNVGHARSGRTDPRHRRRPALLSGCRPRTGAGPCPAPLAPPRRSERQTLGAGRFCGRVQEESIDALDGVHEIVQIHGLRHIGVGMLPVGVLDVVGGCGGGEHHYGDAAETGVVLEDGKQLPAVHPRHVEIENDQIRALMGRIAQILQRGHAVVDLGDDACRATFHEGVLDEQRVGGVVLDEEHAVRAVGCEGVHGGAPAFAGGERT
jgi:uncharacterized NAD(P)/FAD-binding protein YdhS